MSDEWDFFFAHVNDAVASIFVDLGPARRAAREAALAAVGLRGSAGAAAGRSFVDEEAPKLHEIGDALEAMISPTCGGQLVGRITGGGRREFYFYGAEPGGLDDARAQP